MFGFSRPKDLLPCDRCHAMVKRLRLMPDGEGWWCLTCAPKKPEDEKSTDPWNPWNTK